LLLTVVASTVQPDCIETRNLVRVAVRARIIRTYPLLYKH
jgi:hypothetical protein